MSIVHVGLVNKVASGSEIGLVNRVSIVQIGLVNNVSIVQIGLVNKVYMQWFRDRPRQQSFHSSNRPSQQGGK